MDVHSFCFVNYFIYLNQKIMANNLYYRPYINRDDGIRHEATNRHHIIPRSRMWIDWEQNMKKLYYTLHMSYHRVFGNWTPIEAIRQLMNINKKVLTKEIQQSIYDILNSQEEEKFYKDWVLWKSKKHFIKK